MPARSKRARETSDAHAEAGWLRESRPDQACERILDGAEKVFVERGVSAAGMAEIAEAAGCSRGTLYRYFPNRHELHLAYVQREALAIRGRVGAAIAGIEDPRERAVHYVLRTLHEVRAKPGTAAWFEPGAAGMAARMSRAAEVTETLIRSFGDRFTRAGPASEELTLRTRFIVRVIVSMLADPEDDPARERALVERFVAPVLVEDRPAVR